MTPTPITGEKVWVGGENHTNGTVTTDENNVITNSSDALGLTLQRKLESSDDDPTTITTDDAGRTLKVVWARIEKETSEGTNYINYAYSTDGQTIDEPVENIVAVSDIGTVDICDGEDIVSACYLPYQKETITTTSLVKYESGNGYYTIMAIDSKGNYVNPILNKVDEEGHVYIYSIKETSVPSGYEPKEEGLKVTNTNNVTDSLKVTKTWDDDSEGTYNAEGLRPENSTVTMHLYKVVTEGQTKKLVQVDNVEKLVISKTGTASQDGGNGQWNNLPVYDEKGNKIKYVVLEESLYGYKTTYNAGNGYTDETTKISTTTTYQGIIGSQAKEEYATDDTLEKIVH